MRIAREEQETETQAKTFITARSMRVHLLVAFRKDVNRENVFTV